MNDQTTIHTYSHGGLGGGHQVSLGTDDTLMGTGRKKDLNLSLIYLKQSESQYLHLFTTM